MSIFTKNKTKQQLIQEIENALSEIDFGSIEIYVHDKTVTQITVRNIQKTSIDINKQHEIGTHEKSPTQRAFSEPEGSPNRGSDPEGKEPKLFTMQARFRRTE